MKMFYVALIAASIIARNKLVDGQFDNQFHASARHAHARRPGECRESNRTTAASAQADAKPIEYRRLTEEDYRLIKPLSTLNRAVLPIPVSRVSVYKANIRLLLATNQIYGHIADSRRRRDGGAGERRIKHSRASTALY
ncbi:hypothetical protein EVAR_45057_1 [Eumeta japonica]|uniref:Uncharacterized protein n=1 Tax=Eumeta variegata TaxID=151549 RepID=A0A4C1ZG41_EUMVA|nr:hypothetical protein EVAR_45057_1 [Eumeta japonica]